MIKRKGTFRVAWKPIAGGVALSAVLALAAPIAFAATQPAAAVSATSTPAVSAAVVKGAADTQSAPSFTRLGGANREATAIAIANAAYPNGARTVVLVDGSQQHFIDALTAVPLAKLLDAPILLASDTDGQTPVVSGATQSEIQSLGATTVYLVGYANTASVRNTLPKSVQHVVALQGKNRYETSGLIAKTLLQISGESSFHTIFVVSGEDSHFVDALSAGPFAANMEAPILLAQSNGALPSQQGYTASVQASYVVGMAGNYAVSVPDPTVIRGDNRYDTSQLLNQQLAEGMAPYKDVIVVDAADTHLIDALTVSPYAATLHAPVVMSNDISASSLPTSTQDFLSSHYPSAAHVIVIGGSGSVSDAIGKDVVQRVARQVVPDHFSGQVEAGTETALSFTIKDGLGHPLEGIPVDFAATGKLDATKNLSTTSAVSDANGNVQVNLYDTYVGDQGTVT
ncbi:MAG: cell wall-binding repeat-containing protein, partial [Firmicutes bacterium]|nr:cell wall-binding repeat-containing protein [Bacillota bacterium]